MPKPECVTFTRDDLSVLLKCVAEARPHQVLPPRLRDCSGGCCVCLPPWSRKAKSFAPRWSPYDAEARKLRLLAWLKRHPMACRFIALFWAGPRIWRRWTTDYPILQTGFDVQEWECAVHRAGNAGIAPECLILWEAIHHKYLPLHYRVL